MASPLNLDTNRKGWTIAAIFAATLAVAGLDYAMPPISLLPLVFIFVIAVSAVAGLRWGLALAVVAAPLYTQVEKGLALMPDRVMAVNTLILLVALAITVILVDISRRHSATAQIAKRDLESSRAENKTLRQLHIAQQAVQQAERRYRELGETCRRACGSSTGPARTWCT